MKRDPRRNAIGIGLFLCVEREKKNLVRYRARWKRAIKFYDFHRGTTLRTLFPSFSFAWKYTLVQSRYNFFRLVSFPFISWQISRVEIFGNFFWNGRYGFRSIPFVRGVSSRRVVIERKMTFPFPTENAKKTVGRNPARERWVTSKRFMGFYTLLGRTISSSRFIDSFASFLRHFSFQLIAPSAINFIKLNR